MKPESAISKIPVRAEGAALSLYHGKRRATQIAALLLIMLIPLVGLLRVDMQAGNFVILGRQVWWSDYYLMLGFWTMLATGAVMTYSSVGTVWCGWACPQNTVSELTNLLTFNLLGKRARVSIASEKSKVAQSKNSAANWVALALGILAISCVLAIIPLLYLYPPDAIWSLITFRPDFRLPRFTYYIYLVFVFAIFLDIALIRHILCRYFCLYRIWQHVFKTKQTLHVEYDSGRAADCAKCNYCETSCFLDLNPTQFKIYDSCINCGECVDACNKLHVKDGSRGLLQFKFGEQRQVNRWRDNVDNLASRVGWAGAIFLIGAGLFAWGYAHYASYDIVAYRADRTSGSMVSDYRVQVSNKVYAPAELALSVKGIPAGSYTLETENLNLLPATRNSVNLHVMPTLARGLHRIIIEARAADGWVGRFEVEHYAAGN
jgi:polyferredoxin